MFEALKISASRHTAAEESADSSSPWPGEVLHVPVSEHISFSAVITCNSNNKEQTSRGRWDDEPVAQLVTSESCLLSALQQLPGRLFPLEELSQEQQRELKLNPPSSTQLRIGVARDWPDARAVWSVWFIPIRRFAPVTCAVTGT